MECLGEAFEHAVLDLGGSAEDFADAFCASTAAARFAAGEPCLVAGMSGSELAEQVLGETGVLHAGRGMLELAWPRGGAVDVEYSSAPSEVRVQKGPEYWAGWVLAYAQWSLGWTFGQLLCVVSATEVLRLYDPLHEAPEEKFVSVVRERAGDVGTSRLQAVRRARGLTQQELAEQAGVSLRSVQMWEQRNKDISRAQVSFVARMARVLGCRTEDLLELC